MEALASSEEIKHIMNDQVIHHLFYNCNPVLFGNHRAELEFLQ